MEMNFVEFNKKMGNTIKESRLLHNYTREYLAELADISPKFLYEVETGKKGCSSYVLYRISNALGLKIDYIIWGDSKTLSGNDFIELMSLFNENQTKAIQDIIKILYTFTKMQ